MIRPAGVAAGRGMTLAVSPLSRWAANRKSICFSMVGRRMAHCALTKLSTGGGYGEVVAGRKDDCVYGPPFLYPDCKGRCVQ